MDEELQSCERVNRRDAAVCVLRPCSTHAEAAEAAVHVAARPKLPHPGATAAGVAGARALPVLRGGVPEEEARQELLHARGLLPVSQGNAQTVKLPKPGQCARIKAYT